MIAGLSGMCCSCSPRAKCCPCNAEGRSTRCDFFSNFARFFCFLGNNRNQIRNSFFFDHGYFGFCFLSHETVVFSRFSFLQSNRGSRLKWSSFLISPSCTSRKIILILCTPYLSSFLISSLPCACVLAADAFCAIFYAVNAGMMWQTC